MRVFALSILFNPRWLLQQLFPASFSSFIASVLYHFAYECLDYMYDEPLTPPFYPFFSYVSLYFSFHTFLS